MNRNIKSEYVGTVNGRFESGMARGGRHVAGDELFGETMPLWDGWAVELWKLGWMVERTPMRSELER